MRTRSVRAVFVVAVCCTVAVGVATAAGPANIYDGGDPHESVGQGSGKPLQRGVVYQASAFPLALRVRPPDALWGGAQYESGRFSFVQLHHLRTGNVPLHGVGDIAGKGQLFRITVLEVRGKTVVIYVESTFAEQPRLPPNKVFPTFLPYAQQMLSSITFRR